jgi:hypothetical protein
LLATSLDDDFTGAAFDCLALLGVRAATGFAGFGLIEVLRAAAPNA